MTGLLRRHRATLLIALGLVAAVAVVVWSGQGGRTGEDLDPANPGPAGAQALARVLDDQSVDVRVARGADELEEASPDAGTTVVVTSTGSLGASTVERLLSAAGASRLVLVEPGPGVTDLVGLEGQPSSSRPGRALRGACADPSYDELELVVDGVVAYPGTGCFGTDDGDAVLVERGAVTYFGAGEALTNDQVLRGDNAALALRLLGQDERLVWYVPSVADLVGDDGVSITSLLPDWIGPGLWLVGLSVVALVLWRVRRLGALSSEPLPVVVKAIETTLSRGRLYRRAGDRAHAAAALRRAARTRAAARLSSSSTEGDALVRDLAHHLDRPVAEVADLLGPDAPAPASDAALITLARQLAELDREVRRP